MTVETALRKAISMLESVTTIHGMTNVEVDGKLLEIELPEGHARFKARLAELRATLDKRP